MVESPVRVSKANGQIERAIRTWQSQFRTLRLQLEDRIGCKIPKGTPMMSWLISFTSDVLCRYKVHENGRTNYEMVTGHRFKQPTCGFGEKVHFKINTDKNDRSKMEKHRLLPREQWPHVGAPDRQRPGHHQVRHVQEDGGRLGLRQGMLGNSQSWVPGVCAEGSVFEDDIDENFGSIAEKPKRFSPSDPGEENADYPKRPQRARLHGWMPRMRVHRTRCRAKTWSHRGLQGKN